MCSRMCQYDLSVKRPGDRIVYYDENGVRREARWDGFARSETLEQVWSRKIWQRITIPVTRFAEKNHTTGKHTFVSRTTQLRGVANGSVVKVVTRAASAAEVAYFGHDRVPLEVSA
jgi:hypothetical protein